MIAVSARLALAYLAFVSIWTQARGEESLRCSHSHNGGWCYLTTQDVPAESALDDPVSLLQLRQRSEAAAADETGLERSVGQAKNAVSPGLTSTSALQQRSLPRMQRTALLSAASSVLLNLDAVERDMAPICLALVCTVLVVTLIVLYVCVGNPCVPEGSGMDSNTFLRVPYRLTGWQAEAMRMKHFEEVFCEGGANNNVTGGSFEAEDVAFERCESDGATTARGSFGEASVVPGSKARLREESVVPGSQDTVSRAGSHVPGHGTLCPFMEKLTERQFEVLGRINSGHAERELLIFLRGRSVFAISVRENRIALTWHGFPPESHDPLAECCAAQTGSTLTIKGMHKEVFATMEHHPAASATAPLKFTVYRGHSREKLFDVENVPRLPLTGKEEAIGCVRGGNRGSNLIATFNLKPIRVEANDGRKTRRLWIKEDEDVALVMLAMLSPMLLHPDKAGANAS